MSLSRPSPSYTQTWSVWTTTLHELDRTISPFALPLAGHFGFSGPVLAVVQQALMPAANASQSGPMKIDCNLMLFSPSRACGLVWIGLTFD
jgi:hypothetical protein